MAALPSLTGARKPGRRPCPASRAAPRESRAGVHAHARPRYNSPRTAAMRAEPHSEEPPTLRDRPHGAAGTLRSLARSHEPLRRSRARRRRPRSSGSSGTARRPRARARLTRGSGGGLSRGRARVPRSPLGCGRQSRQLLRLGHEPGPRKKRRARPFAAPAPGRGRVR